MIEEINTLNNIEEIKPTAPKFNIIARNHAEGTIINIELNI